MPPKILPIHTTHSTDWRQMSLASPLARPALQLWVRLTYCFHLLREGKKRDNLKAQSLSPLLGCPSPRATAPWKISPADGRQVSPEKCSQPQLPRTETLHEPTSAVPPACSQRWRSTEGTESGMDSENTMLSHSTHCTSLGPACPGRRSHMAPGPKRLHSKEQVSPEPGLSQGEWIKEHSLP